MTDTITIIDTSEITTTINNHELKGASADELQATFAPIFEAAKQWREKAAEIKVTSLAQTAVMGEARKTRLEIKTVRINAEKAKDRLKADSLRYGRAVQGLYNTILELTEPVEKYLQDQEDYAKRLQQAAQAEQRDLRTCEAGDLIRYFPAGVDIGTIADEEFAKLLHFATVQSNAIRAENERLEKERIEKDQRESAEREAMRAENERLKADAAKVEEQRAKEREAVQKAEREYNAKLAAERAEVERLRREADAKAQEERERIAAENRKQMEADNAERERLHKEQEAKEAAEKADLEAPDRDKFRALADTYASILKPEFQNDDWDSKYRVAMDYISKGIKYMREQ